MEGNKKEGGSENEAHDGREMPVLETKKVLVKRRGKEARIEEKHFEERKALHGDLNVEWYEYLEE